MSFCRIVDEECSALGHLPSIFLLQEAAVDDLDYAVRLQQVFSRDPFESSFERMIQPSNFIPASQVAVDVKILNRRHPGGDPEPDPIVSVHGGPGGGPLQLFELAWQDFTGYYHVRAVRHN